MPARDDRNRQALRCLRTARTPQNARATLPRLWRGIENFVIAEWRRCEMGTNHIACFGIWRRGTRRQPRRPNRTGATRWHKPYKSQAKSDA